MIPMLYFGTTKNTSGHGIVEISCNVDPARRFKLENFLDSEEVYEVFRRHKVNTMLYFKVKGFTILGCAVSLHDSRGGSKSLIVAEGDAPLSNMLLGISINKRVEKIFEELNKKYNFRLITEEGFL